MKRLGLAASFLLAAAALASPSGNKWFPGRIPVNYRVFASPTINGMPANSFNGFVLPRVQEAFLAWTSTRVACTAWRTNYTGTFTSPAGPSAVNGNDGQNTVIWLGGSSWRYNSSTLGLTTTLYFSNTGEITDADMEMNDNIRWNNNGDFNSWDYESVVLHEAGHFLGLDHTPGVSGAVMYPTISNGTIKRTLVTPDINDVCGIYPGSGTGSQGNPCTQQSQCTGGLVCRSRQGSTGGKICTVDCTSNMNACSTVMPFTCQAADTGRACLPPPASSDYCKFCVSGADCSSGNCLIDGSGHAWCTNACSQLAPCPTGSVCLDVGTGNSCSGGSCVCAPQPTAQGVLCPNQCTGTACGTNPGYECVNTTCQASGNEGDRCETSGICDPCLICIGTQAAATCRRCCGGNGGGGSCNACPNNPCSMTPVMNSCVALQGSNDRICYPTNGADLCQPCSATVTCLNGNQCVGGRCHSSCNPQSPGGCSACLPQSPTNGICACPGEERGEGESCGGAGTVQACRTGLVCASSVCRRTCVNDTSCQMGSTCVSQGGGVSVCIPSASGTRCAPCNGVSCSAGNTCFQGRCYATCNITVKPGPCDYSCVDVGGGINLCACDDQIVGSGQQCGANPIAACGDRLLCLNGKCTGECNPNFNTCPILTECRLLTGTQFTFVCQPIDMGTGGGGGGGMVNPLDCTSAGATCPNGSSCVPNGDGTATCRSDSASCDPNASLSQCPVNKVCRSVDGMVGQFRCQTPAGGNDFGCGCNSGLGGLFVALAALLLGLRRR